MDFKLQSPIKHSLPENLTADMEALKRKNVIDIVANQTLAARLAEIIDSIDYIEDPTEPIEKRVAKLNRMVIVAGWAWAAAGDNAWMDGQLTRWNLVMARWRDKLALIRPREGVELGFGDWEPSIYVLELTGKDGKPMEVEVEDDITVNPLQLLSPAELKYLVVGYGERDVIMAGLTILHRTFKDKHASVMYVSIWQNSGAQTGSNQIVPTSTLRRPQAGSGTGMTQ